MTAATTLGPAGSATGIGSLPGTDLRAALRLVLDELPDLPYLPELPGRGVGADLIGRSVAQLADLHAELAPSGWRLAAHAGRDERRAGSYLRHDLDLLEEYTQGYTGALKIQLAGPWTLAATLELPRGAAALADPGAYRDIAASLAAGAAAHVAEVRARVPGAAIVLQLDEPALPAVLNAAIPTVSGLATLRAVPPAVVREALQAVVAAVAGAAVGTDAPVPVVVHCCAPGVPLGLLREAGVAGISFDATLLRPDDAAAHDELGTAVEAGLTLLLGVVPALGSAGVSDPASNVEDVRRVQALWRRLGFAPERLGQSVVVTPTCGLAGASWDHAAAATRRCRAAARALLDDPEG